MLEIGLGNPYIRVGSITLFMGLMLLYQIHKKSPEYNPCCSHEHNISCRLQSEEMRQSDNSNERDLSDSSSGESEPYVIKIEVTKNKTNKKSSELFLCERNINVNNHQLNHKKVHVGGDTENFSKKPSSISNSNKNKKASKKAKTGEPKLMEKKKVNKNKISPLIKVNTKSPRKTNKETLNTYNGDQDLHKDPSFFDSTDYAESSNNVYRLGSFGMNKEDYTPAPKLSEGKVLTILCSFIIYIVFMMTNYVIGG